MVVSEHIGQFFFESEAGRDRLEYTEYGSGESWVVLLHGQLIPRRMHQPLARALAAEGLHVVTLDLLGHGRSDRPADSRLYSMTAFGSQVIALLDHLDAPQAVIGGTSLGANVSLEVAVRAPERVRGLILEMPVLDNAVVAALLAFSPLLYAARFAPLSISAVRWATRPVPRRLVPFWAGVGLDTLDQHPEPMAAVIHGLLFGRFAPPRAERQQIAVPALVVGHAADPVHPLSDAATAAAELPRSTFVQARTILEWRLRPERLNRAAAEFALGCWRTPRRRRRASSLPSAT